MASPAFQGAELTGPNAYDVAGGWASSRTISTPSFAAGTCIVAIVYDYIHSNSLANLDHWTVPSSWTSLGIGGNILSGGSTSIEVGIHLYQCARADVASTFRPEKADNTLFTPSGSADNNYWRVIVTGWSPWRVSTDVSTGSADSTRNRLPYSPPSPFITGANEGTWVEFAAGSIAWGGGPNTLGGASVIQTANGFSLQVAQTTYAQLQIAAKAYSAAGSTAACIFGKATGTNAIGAAIAVALDGRPPGGIYVDGAVHVS